MINGIKQNINCHNKYDTISVIIIRYNLPNLLNTTVGGTLPVKLILICSYEVIFI